MDYENEENQEEPAEQAEEKNTMGSRATESFLDRDSVRVADRLSGGKITKGADKIAEKIDQTRLGQTVNKARQTVDEAKTKAIDTATKPLKEAGRKVAGKALEKGTELAAKAGLSAAAGAATAGASTAVQAGLEAAKKTSEISDKVRNVVKKATGGLIDPDIFGDLKDKLKKYWKDNKWKIIGRSCLVLALLAIAPFVITIVMISKFLFSDNNEPTNKAIINSISSLNSSQRLFFTGSGDLDAIKNGEIAQNSLKMINYLAKKHQRIEINYSPKTAEITGGTNEPYEFDIVSVDEIRCSQNGQKVGTIPIYLNYNYDFATAAKDIPDSAICASGYYPNIELKTQTMYHEHFSPGEFGVSEIATKGKMAAQEKLAEVVEDIFQANSYLKINSDSEDSVLPATIIIDDKYATINQKDNSAGILVVMKEKILHYYPAGDLSGGGVVKSTEQKYGIHISYL